ncbi:hypothetical protein T492DRAFT_965001 [Pavlovales sp. CCMP2436]|nr:hypothetical protein T492DRAFT_965001 [Pavlovales sp. CCMP2436]
MGTDRRELSSATRAAAALLALAAPVAPITTPRALGFVVSTLNVHCPAYRKLPCGDLEQHQPELFLARHSKIVELPLWDSSDFVALQEVWYACPEVHAMFVTALQTRFHLHGLQRGFGRRGRERPDGLMLAVKRQWNVLAEVEVDFADVGDRCAQLLHVRRASDGRELLLINTHLLFAHNRASHRIQLREVHKILAAVDGYKASVERSRGLGGGSCAPLPLVLCGDLNTPPRGEVAALLRTYGFASSFHEVVSKKHGASRALGAVTHRAHTGELVSCDYILCANPSAPRPAARKWADVVFAELWGYLSSRGCRSTADAFDLLCAADEQVEAERLVAAKGTAEAQAGGEGGGVGVALQADSSKADSRSFSAEGWLKMLTELGLGEACAQAAALTDAEMRALHGFLDDNSDGRISKEEWVLRLEAVLDRERARPGSFSEGDDFYHDHCLIDEVHLAECPTESYDIRPVKSALFPPLLMRGQWPGVAAEEGGHDGDWVSDHGALTTCFDFVAHALDQSAEDVLGQSAEDQALSAELFTCGELQAGGGEAGAALGGAEDEDGKCAVGGECEEDEAAEGEEGLQDQGARLLERRYEGEESPGVGSLASDGRPTYAASELGLRASASRLVGMRAPQSQPPPPATTLPSGPV